jgi:hypothetical protein
MRTLVIRYGPNRLIAVFESFGYVLLNPRGEVSTVVRGFQNRH